MPNATEYFGYIAAFRASHNGTVPGDEIPQDVPVKASIFQKNLFHKVAFPKNHTFGNKNKSYKWVPLLSQCLEWDWPQMPWTCGIR